MLAGDRKGIGLIFPNQNGDWPGCGVAGDVKVGGHDAPGESSGNATKLGEGGKGPGKSYLFFLTGWQVRKRLVLRAPGIRLAGDRGSVTGKAAHCFACCPVHS